jgi:hypothetical protein
MRVFLLAAWSKAAILVHYAVALIDLTLPKMLTTQGPFFAGAVSTSRRQSSRAMVSQLSPGSERRQTVKRQNGSLIGSA